MLPVWACMLQVSAPPPRAQRQSPGGRPLCCSGRLISTRLCTRGSCTNDRECPRCPVQASGAPVGSVLRCCEFGCWSLVYFICGLRPFPPFVSGCSVEASSSRRPRVAVARLPPS
eukprot:5133245-Pyramimonas_sp.AAC.1